MGTKLEQKIKLAKFKEEEFGLKEKTKCAVFLDTYDLEILHYYITTTNPAMTESNAVRELLRAGFERFKENEA